MSDILFFDDLYLRNFLSFGNTDTHICLSNPGTILIEGINLDNGGSNGAGKTAIFNAICYAIYNTPFDNISLQRLVNSTNATKNTKMEVTICFRRGKDSYSITRTRGEQYSIAIVKNGVDITPGKGVSECDALILSIIGISYELFTKTIVFSGNSPAFLQLPIAQQRAQVEELFNISLLSKKAVRLKEQIKQDESDLRVQEAIVSQQVVANELHNKHITDAKARIKKWEEDRIREIATIEKTLASIVDVDFETEQLLHDEKARIQLEISPLKSKHAALVKDATNLAKDIKKFEGELEHLHDAKCPYCTQTFADAPAKISSIHDIVEAAKARHAELTEQINKMAEDIELQAQNLALVNAEIKYPDLKALLKSRDNASSLQSKLLNLQISENPHTDALSKLQTESYVIVESDKIDSIKRLIEHKQFLLKLLINKDSFIRRRIINKTIPFLNTRINEYTAILGLPHIVKFDADLSCSVSEFGRELDFGNLSAGEKRRVNTGMALAFRDVLHHLHAKTNLLLIDELDGQLDDVGLNGIVRTIKEKSRDDGLAIFVISHHPMVVGRLDRVLSITKEHGFSTIKE